MMKSVATWPKAPTKWIKGRTLFVSVPFTWDLPGVKSMLEQRSFFWDRAIVGGPAVSLMPDYFSALSWVEIKPSMPGVLQRVNPFATRTTTGCVNHCGFCGVGRIEGEFKALSDWPDLPVLCDNNLLAAPAKHFDRVVDRLKNHVGVDFNQGLDARRLSAHHATRFAEIKGIAKRGLRLALDSMSYAGSWEAAFDLLLAAGIAKRKISTYVLVAYNSDPTDAWARCELVEKHKIRALPMWYHPLNALQKNQVTDDQKALGWTDYERRRIMQWFYQHKKAVA